MVEVQVTKPQYSCDINEFVEKLIESMQERASNADGTRGIHGVCLRALKGLRVWTVSKTSWKMDVKCALAVSTLDGTLAFLRYGNGLDRWANMNPI